MSDSTNPYTGQISPGTPSSEVDAATLDGASLSTDATLVNNSDTLIPSEKAVKTYVDGKDSDVDDRLDIIEDNVVIVDGVSVTIPNALIASGAITASAAITALSTVGITGLLTLAGKLKSNVADGTTPLEITSTTKVANLNADKFDGCDIEDSDSLGTSDAKVSTQGNVKAYVDTTLAASKTYVSKTIVAADSTYAITDADMTSYDMLEVNSTDGAVILTLPDRATNNGKRIKIKHSIQDASLDIVTVNAAGTDKITADEMTSIILPKAQNFIEVFASSVTGTWEILDESIASDLILSVYAGYGSTDNKIMRFTNAVENNGNMFSENHSTGYDSDAEGLEITIQRSGRYAFLFYYIMDADFQYAGLTKNSAELTTSYESTTVATRMVGGWGTSTYLTMIISSVTVDLKKGDTIRPHADGDTPYALGTDPDEKFYATYLGQ